MSVTSDATVVPAVVRTEVMAPPGGAPPGVESPDIDPPGRDLPVLDSPGLDSPGLVALVARGRAVQRRTLSVLGFTQTVGGIGVAIGFSVGALLTAQMAGTSLSGVAASAAVVGTALFAVPAARLMRWGGRRPGLAFAYLVGAVGSVLIVAAAVRGALPLLFGGLFLFGAGTTANLQARYTAVDLAEPARRGRQLSLIVWATTIGAVAGPNVAPLAGASMHRFGLTTYSGPFVFSAVAFVVAAVVILVFLRPDPLLTAREIAAGSAAAGLASTSGASATSGALAGPGAPAALGVSEAGAAAPMSEESTGLVRSSARTGMRAAAREVWGLPRARLGIAAVAVAHVMMVGVMSMTPVHIGASGHADVLRIVGIVLSAHIIGMYALSPVMGWLSDRLGRRSVIVGGVVLLLASCGVAGTAGHDVGRLSLGLGLLGLGWSANMVAGSTLLSESVEPGNQPAAQGLSDLVMGLAGASAGALSGVVVAWSSYLTLTLLSALTAVPLLALALRPALRVRQPRQSATLASASHT